MASRRTPKSKSKRRRKNTSFQYSTLECRRVLATTVTFDPGTGLIQIEGDNANNQIDVFEDLGDLVVQTDDDVLFYNPSQVTQINFNARNGDDIFYNETSIPTRVFGHGGDDYIRSGEGNDFVHAGDGNDTLEGAAGDDQLRGGNGIDDIRGENGNDTLYGGRENDTIFGGQGDDFINGEFGDDILFGSAGNDTMLGFSGVDNMQGGGGDDIMYGQAGNDIMMGNDGADRVRGNPGNDELHGDNGDDVVMGDQGDDLMYGGFDNDTMIAFDGQDVMYGGFGNDFMYGQNGDDLMYGEGGEDIVRGGNDNDELYGGNDDDSVIGDAGHDRLFGEDGADFLNAGDGNDGLVAGGLTDIDRMKGGAGADRFIVQSTPSLADLIVDHATEDATVNFLDETSAWTDAEIAVVDNAFSILHKRTGNTFFLKDSIAPGDLTFYKYTSVPNDNMGGANELTNGGSGYSREIHIGEWVESDEVASDEVMAVAIRQIAHNWDSVLEQETLHGTELAGQYNTFTALSDWQNVDPGSGYTQSTDGQWYYQSSAAFSDDHGRTNPMEDFATSWEYYFRNYEDVGMNHGDLQSKFDFVDDFMDIFAT